ncbi:MAG: ester cyclase [Chloroflexia bacterium]
MSPEENKPIILRYLDEAWNKKNRAVIDEVISPDLVQNVRNVPPGQEGVKRFFDMIDAAFPDAHLTVADIIAEGDRVASRFTVTGTHSGPFSRIPPTGKPITLTGMAITRMRDGRMVESWNETDDLGMMQQLGIIPAPGQGPNSPKEPTP